MVAITVITAAAHKETAKQAIIKRLRDAEASNAAMPSSLEVDSDDAKSALDDLLAAGKVREARAGLYFLDESAAKAAAPGLPFVIILAFLVIASCIASLVAIVSTSG
jgi:hypothetical protein